MIAEHPTYKPHKIESSIPLGKAADEIINSFITTTPYFKNHIKQFTHKTLNEEELTQEFVNLLRRKTIDLPFLIGQEKKDLYFSSKGRVDFFFYSKEETETTKSIFDVEAKLLTDRFTQKRKKEYVIGENKNGGIERFKIEKHGKGLQQCGIVGFIEKFNSTYWIKSINTWIEEQSIADSLWHQDEILENKLSQPDYSYSTSKAQRISSCDILLHHFWITLK
ncbi:MAG: hypothetical protein K9H26_11605 [Prolixibacteraceae bacterium]|nr:hypothetical protein [Prolixibacteraceae bacterium]